MEFSRMLQVPSTSGLPGNGINQSKQIQLSNGFINLINCVHISLKIAMRTGCTKISYFGASLNQILQALCLEVLTVL